MKRVLVLAIAPLVATAFAGAVLANGESSVNTGADTRFQRSADAGTSGAEADAEADIGADTDLDTGTTASTGEEARFGSVISAIQASDSVASDIEAMTDAARLEIVRVSDIAEGESMNALDAALSRNQAKVDELRGAIEANTAVSDQLRQEQVQPDDVVAAEMTDDGSLRIYTR